jgi:phenylacetate-CoA ligase
LDAAEVTPQDVAMMAFSFGPFIGFWTANDALVQRGATVVAGGGMSSEARLDLISDHRCSIVCCTPTYALHLAAVAAERGVDLASGPVSRIIVAGEPGGSVPAVRRRIEGAWGARLIDHSGASEVGAWGVGSRDGRGLHVIESEFIAELLCFDDEHPLGLPAAEGEQAELVLTNLGRLGGPAIRYRTGDIVRGYRQHDYDCRFLWLEGGVLGRADDMMVVRGVNVFPSSIEAIVREVDAVAEFRMIATRSDEMDQLALEIETDDRAAAELTALLRDRLAMRVGVRVVDSGSLPRFEAKSRRWIDRREEDGNGADDG